VLRRPDPQHLAEPDLSKAHRLDAGCGRTQPRPLRSCRADDPAVSVVVTVPSSEGTVLIDYQWEGDVDADWQTLTAAELAATTGQR
jgi:hypothetical protein